MRGCKGGYETLPEPSPDDNLASGIRMYTHSTRNYSHRPTSSSGGEEDDYETADATTAPVISDNRLPPGGLMTDIQSSREDQYSREEIAQFISFAGSSTCLLLCAFSLTPYMGFSFVVVAMACFGATNSGVGCAFLDVSLRYSSTIYTLANLGGAIAGLDSPLLVSFSCEGSGVASGVCIHSSAVLGGAIFLVSVPNKQWG